jgi:cytoskeletal protein CcmA (bactofilin family)
MAIPILNHLNVKGNITLNDYKLQDFVVDHSTTGDAGNTAGKLIYDSGTLKYYDGSTWQSLGTSSGTMSSWVLEDGDGTEVSIADAKEIKFVEGGGLDINWTDVDNGTDADPYDLTFTINSAQTGIETIYNSGLIIGYGASDATIKFTTDNRIDFFIDGTHQVSVKDGSITPETNNDVDLGANLKQFKDLYIDGTANIDTLTLTSGASVTAINDTDDFSDASATTLATSESIKAYVDGFTAGTVTVSDSTANTAFPVVFHDESNGLLDDTGALTYNPSTGSLSVANLTVTGTQTVNNVNVIETSSGVIFEGSTADDFETTLDVVDPTADRAINLPNASGTVVLEDNTATLTNKTIAISQVTELSNLTATEGAQLENIDSVTISNAQWGYVGALDQGLTTTSDVAFNSLDIEGNIDVNGTTNLDAVDIDGAVQIDATVTVGVDDTGYDVKFFGDTASKYMLWDASADTLILTGELDAGSLDISGNADIDGTLEADAITVNGTALDTVIDNRIKVVQKTATIDVSSLVSNVFKCNIAHNMNSNNLIVKLYDGTTYLDVFADVDRTDANTLQITFSHEPTNDIVVVIQEIIGDNIAAGANITYPTS